MKLRLKAAAMVAAIVGAAVVAAPAPASAAWESCWPGFVCFYDGPGGTGESVRMLPADTPYIGDAWDDRPSSMWNTSSGQVCIWTDPDFNGLFFSVPPGGQQELMFLYDNSVTSFSVSGCGG